MFVVGCRLDLVAADWIRLPAGTESTGKHRNEAAASLAMAEGILPARREASHPLFFIQILLGNIILRYLVRANLPLIGAPGVFHALHYVSFKRVSLFEQLVDTFRIRTLDVG